MVIVYLCLLVTTIINVLVYEQELEKELKEEKCKKMVIRDRLSRAEGQIKMGTERASQLEATLEQARSQNWTLERTVQQLHEQVIWNSCSSKVMRIDKTIDIEEIHKYIYSI